MFFGKKWKGARDGLSAEAGLLGWRRRHARFPCPVVLVWRGPSQLC